MSDIASLERGIESRAVWWRKKGEDEVASLRARHDDEVRTLKSSHDASNFQEGCIVFLWGLLALIVAAACFLASASVGPDQRGYLAVAGSIALGSIGLCLIIQLLARDNRKRLLEERRREIMRPVSQIGAEAQRVESELRNVAKQLETLRSTLATSAEELLASENISCSLVLLDPGAKEDGYDEGKLAQALVGISRDHINSKSLSPALAKDLIRDCPRVFLTALSIPDAEGIAARLRREFKASAGIKRRFIGEFPPSMKAIEAPPLPT